MTKEHPPEEIKYRLSNIGEAIGGIALEYIAELEDELKKWKDEWQEQVQKVNDEGYARTLQTMQLTKAKELLKRYVPYRQITDSKAYKDLAEETEQFLNSEVEK